VRIATWNVNSVVARLPRLVEWPEQTAPAAVGPQEAKSPDGAFPRAEVEALGYQVAAHGDGRWNGVALLSRAGLADVTRGLRDQPGFPAAECRAIGATCGPVRLWSVYVPSGREPGHEHYAYKLAWLGALRGTVKAELAGGAAPYAVCGDYNVAPADEDVWDITAFAG
jgi:exodeoxyribonuclease-3